ncbi:MAG: hypothetical protein IT423_18925, partial [Pirellulaceae bacterium]|nr:hypothetical protein [Pirellulaceae bacterium]
MVSGKPACTWMLLGVGADGLIELEVTGTALSNLGGVNSLWTHDIDSDGTAEHFVSQRFGSAQGLDNNGEQYQRNARTTFACYEAHSGEPKWEVSVDDPVGRYVQIRNVFWSHQDGASLAWLDLYGRFVLVDLLAGQIVGEVVGDKRLVGDQRPWVVELRGHNAESNSIRVRGAIPTADGMMFRWLGGEPEFTSLSGIHRQSDPRLMRPLFAVGTLQTTSELLLGAVRSLVSAIFLIVLPIKYFGTMIRRRRWSLSWLLLAPPVVMFALIVGSSDWFRQQSVYYLMQGIGWISVLVALYVSVTQRNRMAVFWGFSWAMIVGFAVLTAAFIVLFSILQANRAPDMHSVITTTGLVVLIVGSSCWACHFYWVARFVRSAMFRLGIRRTETSRP